MEARSDTPVAWLISGLCVCVHVHARVHACVMHVSVHIYLHVQRPEEEVSCLSMQLCLILSSGICLYPLALGS